MLSPKNALITSRLDRNTALHSWSEDGDTIYFVISEDNMRSQLSRYLFLRKQLRK